MPIMKVLNDSRVPVKIWTDDVEGEALQQLKNMAAMPFVFKHVAVMPDVHAGKGATVGSVVATRGAVMPAAVGVECRKDNEVIDEIPGAYKAIEDVMKNQDDLVEVVAELKQVLCVKG